MVSHFIVCQTTEEFLGLIMISPNSQFCSTALLIDGPDQSFEYIACGSEARTDTLFRFPNTAEAKTTPAVSTFLPTISLGISAAQTSSTVSATSSLHVPAILSPISTSSKQEPVNLGAIIGGVIGGITVICLTIVGIIFIRRNHAVQGQAMPLSDQSHKGQSGFADYATLHIHNQEYTQKNHHGYSSHHLVEMYSGTHADMEPAELPGSRTTSSVETSAASGILVNDVQRSSHTE
jgi:hypothetical protein